MVFNTSPTGTDIWINGFNFAPYRIDRNLTPIQIGDTIPYQTDNANGTIPLSYSGGFFNFNIQPYFPLRLKTGGFVQDEWYYKTGLLLGPFDKDIEVGISNGEVLAVYSDFYVNGKQTSHWFYNGASCDRDWAMQVCNDRFLRCGEPAFTLLPRNVGYSIIAVIPANTVGVFNIHSAPDDPTYSIIPSITDVSRNYIGMPSGCILSLRTHEPLDANDFEPLLQTGEQGRMESNFYINNSIPTKYTINHTLGIEGLIGVHEFQNYGYTGKLYPIPDTTAFQALASYDSNNNIIYGPNITPENYWKLYAIKNHTTVTFSGYREGSRVSFEITNLKLLYDKVPFQVYNLVAPSGTCILSGEMGYYAQADNTVFTEGFYLTNATPNDLLAQSYNPSYVSDVLKLIPSGLFQFPVVYSGSGQTAPVLQAPSVMKQRQNESGISPDQTYYYLFRSPSQNYNKLLWPALSDLETLNPGETMESIAPGDGNTFSNSTMIFSASQGQALPNGLANPKILKTYTVQNIFQTYDSVATVSSLNSGICITSGRGTSVSLNQSQMSGALVPVGTPLSLVIQGLF